MKIAKILCRKRLRNFFRFTCGYIFDPTVPDGVRSDTPDHLPSKVLDGRNNVIKLVRDITNFSFLVIFRKKPKIEYLGNGKKGIKASDINISESVRAIVTKF